MEKVLIADFSNGKDRVTARGLWQFDRGVKLKVIGINVADVNRVDFASVISSDSVPVVVVPDVDGTFTVSIPGAVTKSSYGVTAYIYVDTADYGYTVKAVNMPVTLRQEAWKPGEEEKPDPFGEVVEKVSGYAKNARYFANAAAESEKAASESATQAEKAKEVSMESAEKAAESKEAAATSATAATESASQARESATAARSAADEATESATDAAESETTAAQQAQNAAQSATNAARSAESASQSAEAAKTAADTAGNSASDAQQAAGSASESASTASVAAQTATTAAGNAAESATSASQSAETAGQKATAAETSASNAAESATDAEKSATAAGDSASAAKTSETAATASAVTVTEQAEKIKASAEQIEKNKTDVASLKGDIAQITKSVEIGGSINLFNKLTVTNDKNISANGTLTDADGYSASDFIPVEANTEYTQMTINDGVMYPLTQYIGFCDADKNAIGATTSEPWYNCTTPSNCAYVRIAFSTELIDTVMFVKGLYSPDGTPSSKMDYVPYSEKYLVFTVRGDKVDFEGTQVEKNEKDIDGLNKDIDRLKKGAILPSYWETYLDGKIAEINSELVKGFCFPVMFVTDTHIEYDTSIESEIIKYMNRKIHFGAVVHGGDFMTSDTSRINAFTKIQNAISQFDGIPNFLTCVGNHDGVNAISGDVLPKNIADSVVNAHLSSDCGIVKPKYNDPTVPQYTALMANGYYYKDDETNRIRYIILNSCDSIRVDGTDHGFAFDNLQLKWLAQNALDLTEKGYGWKVAIFSHLFSKQSGIIGSELEPDTYQIDVLKDILEAFIAKTSYSNTSLNISVDYENQPSPKFCGYFCGHYHYDSQTKVGNIPVSVTLNASLNQYAPSGYPATEKTVGTTTETAMDVLIFGKDKCILKRIGAGNDREFTY